MTCDADGDVGAPKKLVLLYMKKITLILAPFCSYNCDNYALGAKNKDFAIHKGNNFIVVLSVFSTVTVSGVSNADVAWWVGVISSFSLLFFSFWWFFDVFFSCYFVFINLKLCSLFSWRISLKSSIASSLHILDGIMLGKNMSPELSCGWRLNPLWTWWECQLIFVLWLGCVILRTTLIPVYGVLHVCVGVLLSIDGLLEG